MILRLIRLLSMAIVMASSLELYFNKIVQADEANKLRCLSSCLISYPSSLRESNLTGIVTIGLQIDSNGNVIKVNMDNSSGHLDLDQAVIEAVKKMQFAPIADPFRDYKIKINFQVYQESIYDTNTFN